MLMRKLDDPLRNEKIAKTEKSTLIRKADVPRAAKNKKTARFMLMRNPGDPSQSEKCENRQNCKVFASKKVRILNAKNAKSATKYYKQECQNSQCEKR